MKCTKCGFENGEGSVFCSKCATKIEAPTICPKCGNENLPDAIFCQKCATRIVPVEYCRFCGGEINALTGRCGQCNRDRSGEAPKFAQAVDVVKKQATQAASTIDRFWLESGLVLLSSAIMVICLLSKWMNYSTNSGLLNALGGVGIPANVSIMNVVKLYQAAIAGTQGDIFIIVPYILIGLSIAAIIYFGMMAKEVFYKNAKAKAYDYSHLKKACAFTLAVMIVFMISVFIMQGQVNELMRNQWEYSGAGINLEVTFGVYLALALSIGGLVYISKRNTSTEISEGQQTVCYNCPATLPKGATFCMACGADQTVPEEYRSVTTSAAGRMSATEVPLDETQAEVCWSCGKPLLEDSTFCMVCGAEQNVWKGNAMKFPLPSNEKICPACGTANVGDSAFCGQCGTSI